MGEWVGVASKYGCIYMLLTQRTWKSIMVRSHYRNIKSSLSKGEVGKILQILRHQQMINCLYSMSTSKNIKHLKKTGKTILNALKPQDY